MRVHSLRETKFAVVSPLIVDLGPLHLCEAVDLRGGAIMLAHAREVARIILPCKVPVFSHFLIG